MSYKVRVNSHKFFTIGKSFKILNTKVENVIRFFKNILMYFLLVKAIYHIFSFKFPLQS